ncbi:hypothetical protein T484DRAFT_1815920 [Baffinella frigidus]|nr:hypothetical protein T484DRAFT_1815920 [Cryptophyta sp. CCMP2293]
MPADPAPSCWERSARDNIFRCELGAAEWALMRASGLKERDTLVAEQLFVLPRRTHHPPHWLEELAQFCNFLATPSPSWNSSRVVLVLQPLPWLEKLLLKPASPDPEAAAARRPIAETLAEERRARAEEWGWGGLYSSILTATLLRRSADIVLLPVQETGAVGDAGAFVAIHLDEAPPRRAVYRRILYRTKMQRDPGIFSFPHAGELWFASARGGQPAPRLLAGDHRSGASASS